MISAKILLDSINGHDCRLTTFVLTFPRMVLAEFNTHRLFSRNAASSRAIPSDRFIKTILEDPAIPVWWGKNQAGMQAMEELDPEKKEEAICLWFKGRNQMIALSRELAALGTHKQICNRVLEPWFFVTMIVSSTNYGNFFGLRCHPDAQPEIQAVADLALNEYVNSTPVACEPGSFHIPFGDCMPDGLSEEEQTKIAVARVGRISYNNFDGSSDPEKDIGLFNRLSSSGHWSPFEHIAQAQDDDKPCGNFKGWKQLRKTMPNECLNPDLDELLAKRKALRPAEFWLQSDP